jgi:hypothetical protein
MWRALWRAGVWRGGSADGVVPRCAGRTGLCGSHALWLAGSCGCVPGGVRLPIRVLLLWRLVVMPLGRCAGGGEAL